MMPAMFDSHAHLDVVEFDQDRDSVIDRALKMGVATIIVVGTDLKSSKKVVRLAEDRPEIKAAAGIDPSSAPGVTKADIAELSEIAASPEVVAIGEIGLDYYHGSSLKEAQQQTLRWQLDLAVKQQLPVILHCRKAEEDLLPLLRQWTTDTSKYEERLSGVIHCFSGTTDTAREYLKMGFFISLGAYIGYPSSRRLAEVIRALPMEKILLETDCPYLPPQNHRGQRNEPAYLSLTVAALAEIRDVSMEVIARVTSENARNLFGIAYI